MSSGEGMDMQAAAQVAVFTSVQAYWYAMSNDGASVIVGAMCGMLPCAAFLCVSNSQGSAATAMDTFWMVTAACFIISFICVMLSVVSKVTHADMDTLLRNSMALFCTGVASAHFVLACLFVGQEETYSTATWGAVSVGVLGLLSLARLKGLVAVLLACGVCMAGAAASGTTSNEVMTSAAAGFVVAGSLDFPHSRFLTSKSGRSGRLSRMRMFALMVRSVMFSATALHYMHIVPWDIWSEGGES